MNFTRRHILKSATVQAAGLLLSGTNGCKWGKPVPRVLPSQIVLPERFQCELQPIQVLRPTSQTDDTDSYDLTAKQSNAQIVPGLTTAIWGFNGTFPGPTLDTQSGRRVIVDLRNDLPVPIVKHVHGIQTSPESDGYPTDLVLPKAGWPAQHMHDNLARVARAVRRYEFPNSQRGATLWYHDHRMDFTGPQIWRGLAGFYVIREPFESRLGLPQGDKEVALLICDRSFNIDGSFQYPSIQPSLIDTPGVTNDYMGGVLGDVMLVNGQPWPRMSVSNTRYRFRIVNASNARHITLALSGNERETGLIIQIGSDGGLLEHPVLHGWLPIAPAERFDIVIDFSRYKVGERVFLKNIDGSGPMADIMCFDIAEDQQDHSEIPDRLGDFERLSNDEVTATRNFDFSYGGMEKGWLINGLPFDPSRFDAEPRMNATERWHFHSDRSHPLHLHLAHFQIDGHAGHPRPSDAGWKDTISMYAGQVATVLVRFPAQRGRFVFHCHNLEHEDMSMMGNFNVS